MDRRQPSERRQERTASILARSTCPNPASLIVVPDGPNRAHVVHFFEGRSECISLNGSDQDARLLCAAVAVKFRGRVQKVLQNRVTRERSWYAQNDSEARDESRQKIAILSCRNDVAIPAMLVVSLHAFIVRVR